MLPNDCICLIISEFFFSIKGVTSIDCYDITGDGQLDLIAGRDDGIIEIYVYDTTGRPTLKQIIVKTDLKLKRNCCVHAYF